ncbi:WD repeat protein [Peniophora sp. CONT]|nr:WD repeat protein [Peniophora sp. CONT]
MKSNYKFSNLCGTVYRDGNVVFTPDGNAILSPVGNRVSVFDLVNNTSRTFAFENRRNVGAIALSPDGHVLVSVDTDGRALLASFQTGVVLAHINFKKPVRALRFSPCGRYLAVTHGSHVQVWRTPSVLVREFAPFVLHRTYTGHHADVTGIEWSPDSKCFISTSKDMTARLFTLNPVEGFRPKTFAGHKDAVVGAYFSKDAKAIYTVSRDGAVFTWRAKPSEEEDEDSDIEPVASSSRDPLVAHTRWGIADRHYAHQPGSLVCATFHAASALLVLGFSTGVFALFELPAFTSVHTLSISSSRISAVSVNASGEWLAFGAKDAGQLLVWEWQSESHVLKQQGHSLDMAALAYAPDGAHVATAGDDGKLKLWDTRSGFCVVTFSQHSASVSSCAFAGNVLFSASLDGTVRAFDLVRYRNFRTFTSPQPAQFAALAVDPSGEVVAAGAADRFELYLWSVQTGKLLDVLSGHDGPVVALAFSPTDNALASGSWDRTVRIWSVFGRSHAVEPISLNSDVLALAYSPDGLTLAVATLDGQIAFFDTRTSSQTLIIDGRRDVAGGRNADDKIAASNTASGKAFTSLTYSADGACVLAGGNSAWVCLYDARAGVLLKRWSTSTSFALDGTQVFLDTRRLTDAGSLDVIDDRGDDSDLEERADRSLPGAQKGDLSKRKYRPTARTRGVRFSPTGRSWAAAATDGLLIYSLDDGGAFDPTELAMDLTPAAVYASIQEKEWLRALLLAFRLNMPSLIERAFHAVPADDILLTARSLPTGYVGRVLERAAAALEGERVEWALRWVRSVLGAHGRWVRANAGSVAPVLRSVRRALAGTESAVAKLCDDNTATLSFFVDQNRMREGVGAMALEPASGMDIDVAA